MFPFDRADGSPLFSGAKNLFDTLSNGTFHNVPLRLSHSCRQP